MAIYTIGLTSFDELIFPEVIYKYREAENYKHRTILVDRIVFFAPPSSFEDKLDCKIPTRYDLLTDDEIYDKYYRDIKAANPLWDETFVRQEAMRWANAGLMRDKDHLRGIEEDYVKQFDTRFGVLSLTANPTNPKMWSKYAKELNGFCVGFDPKIMFPFLGGGGPVEYCDNLPIIHPFEPHADHHMKQAFSKLREFEFEQEYRTHKFYPKAASEDDRKVTIPCEAYVEIIIGENVQPHIRTEIINECRTINSSILIKIAKLKGLAVSIENI